MHPSVKREDDFTLGPAYVLRFRLYHRAPRLCKYTTREIALASEEGPDVHRTLASQLHLLQAQCPFARGDDHPARQRDHRAW